MNIMLTIPIILYIDIHYARPKRYIFIRLLFYSHFDYIVRQCEKFQRSSTNSNACHTCNYGRVRDFCHWFSERWWTKWVASKCKRKWVRYALIRLQHKSERKYRATMSSSPERMGHEETPKKKNKRKDGRSWKKRKKNDLIENLV